MNECLMTPQHKNKSAIGCEINVLVFSYISDVDIPVNKNIMLNIMLS